MSERDDWVVFALGMKGLRAIEGLLAAGATIRTVVTAVDHGVTNDYSGEIAEVAHAHGAEVVSRSVPRKMYDDSHYLAAGWRWMIRDAPANRLIVLHDSLLPKYRGFAPLVNALIRGEPRVGVTAIWGRETYDSGPIIAQRAIDVRYPIKIRDAIAVVAEQYFEIAHILGHLPTTSDGIPAGTPQLEGEATLSIWRDEEDYRVDWTWDATQVKRFVDAVGEPYGGARCLVDGAEYIVDEVEVRTGDRFEFVHPGKVYRLDDGRPLVMCGSGAVSIVSMRNRLTGESVLPFERLRVRVR